VLVGTDKPDAVRQRLAEQNLSVLTRDQLRASDLKVITRAIAVPMKIMVGVAFAIGVLVIALTAYSSIIERSREYGILKALGATQARLYRLALEQSLLLALIGLAAGAGFFAIGRGVIGLVRPQFTVVVTPMIVGRAGGVALIMGGIAALVPARRLARLDPAATYSGG
jgi:putative ABC transport system permease protein